MKRVLSIILTIVLLTTGLFILTGCENGGNNGSGAKKKETTEITYVHGKGKITVSVPKNEDGTPKYQFTDSKEQPEQAKMRSTFYLITDNAALGFATSGLVYNTAIKYKEKYGEEKAKTATFDGYLEWMDDADSGIKLNGLEKIEINGRKAIKYNMLEGSSNNYKYFGYIYRIATDDVYPGSGLDLDVTLNKEGTTDGAPTMDEETQDIINSIKIEQNQ